MIESKRFRVLFVHVPKTGGTSVAHALGISPAAATLRAVVRLSEADGDPPDEVERFARYVFSPHHLPAAAVRARLPPDVWSSHYRFAVVRNPWERAVSEFAWRRTYALPGAGDGTFASFVRAVASGELPPDADHLVPQFDMLHDARGELLVDRACRFERLQADFDEVCEHVGAPRAALPRHTASVRAADYRDEYAGNPDLVALVGAMYARDAAAFGYAF